MSHRWIQQWNQWVNQKPGQQVLQAEKALLDSFLAGIYGKHALLLGVPQQASLLESLASPCHLLLTPLLYRQQGELKGVESSLNELPILSGSVDLVILPHTLELVDNPRQVLSEACRIVKPEGHIILLGFNPYSLWGLKKKRPTPRLINSGTLKKWLNLADFELIKQSSALYGLPRGGQRASGKFDFMEWLGKSCHLPWGGVYMLMARAKVIPLTPIRLRWKQSLSSVTMPTPISGPSIRNSK